MKQFGCHSDYDEITAEGWGDPNEGQVSVAFIAVLPLLFGAGLIFLAYWFFR